MELEKQVCSLDLAKRLKEFGVKQESLFYWKSYRAQSEPWEVGPYDPGLLKSSQCSAFTVAELGEMLPATIRVSEHGADFVGFILDIFKRDDGVWCAGYENYGAWDPDTEPQERTTLADALASLLIYLLEKKLLTS